MKARCSNCRWWKNNQRYLNYREDIGFCLNPDFRFDAVSGRPVGVIDLHNLKKRMEVRGNPSHDFETFSKDNPLKIEYSRYLLSVDKSFCCNRHQPDNSDQDRD